MPDLRVLLLSDGLPGHFNLSEGIVAAMARRRPVRVQRLEVRRRYLLSGQVAAAAIAAGLPAAAILRLAHDLDVQALPPADVVVSAGGATLPGNIAAARALAVPNIFYGSLRTYRRAWFALTLTSYAAQARQPHPVMTLKPSQLDPDLLPPLATPDTAQPPRQAGLLVGGTGGGVRFREADWTGLEDMLCATHAAWGTTWTVSNSRRTPNGVSDRLAALQRRVNGPVARFIDVRSAGAGTLVGLFEDSELIAVTTDSSSMLSEAVWSRRPVISLAPAVTILTPQESAYRRHLEQAECCRQLPIAETSPKRMLALLGSLRPLRRNPLDQLADVLAMHLPELLPAPWPHPAAPATPNAPPPP